MRNIINHIKYTGICLLCMGMMTASAQDNTDTHAGKINRSFTIITTTKGKEIKERTINDSALSKIKQDEAFWYANIKPVRQQPDGKLPFWMHLISQDWFRLLIWLVIAGGFAAVLIWYLASLNVCLFKKTPPHLAAPSAPEEAADIYHIDYDREIANAVQQQNYRLAIRLHYLQLLKNLSQQNIIQYHSRATNADYIQQLAATHYYKDFFRLTRHFEYNWYGQINISSKVYAAVQHDFETFKQQLPS